MEELYQGHLSLKQAKHPAGFAQNTTRLLLHSLLLLVWDTIELISNFYYNDQKRGLNLQTEALRIDFANYNLNGLFHLQIQLSIGYFTQWEMNVHCFSYIDYSINQIDYEWVGGVVCGSQTANFIKKKECDHNQASMLRCTENAFVSVVLSHFALYTTLW